MCPQHWRICLPRMRVNREPPQVHELLLLTRGEQTVARVWGDAHSAG